MGQNLGGSNGAVKGGQVANDVVGGEREQKRLGVLFQQHQRGDRDGGRGVAAQRLQYQGARHHADVLQLLGDLEAVLVVADDQRGTDPT
jgi:hypothetical protein